MGEPGLAGLFCFSRLHLSSTSKEEDMKHALVALAAFAASAHAVDVFHARELKPSPEQRQAEQVQPFRAQGVKPSGARSGTAPATQTAPAPGQRGGALPPQERRAALR
jgi:hypothetical protein